MQNAERNTSSSNQHKRHERIIPLVIACFSTTKLLEPIEKAFHYISTFVGFFIKGPRLFCIHLWRNRVIGSLTVQILSNFFCTIGFVAENRTIFQAGKLLEQRNSFCTVVNIASRQQKSNRTKVFSDKSVNLRVQPSACFADAA